MGICGSLMDIFNKNLTLGSESIFSLLSLNRFFDYPQARRVFKICIFFLHDI